MDKDQHPKINVLFAPAHYLVDESAGSEFAWAYNIVRFLSRDPRLSLRVIGGTINAQGLSSSAELFPLYRSAVRLTLSARLLFVYRVFCTAKTILNHSPVDIIHHILPFGYGQTFNLLPLLGRTRSIPFVVGPLQAPLQVPDSESMILVQDSGFRRLPLTSAAAGAQEAVLRLASPLLGVLSHKTLQAADAVICCSKAARKLYSPSVDARKVQVIPPGIDLDAFRYVERPKKKDLEIVTACHLVKRKRVDLLIDAVAGLLPRYPTLRLRIIGDGPEMRTLVSQVNRMALQGNVILEGFVPNHELEGYYQRADLYCTLSLAESFGQSLVEAMATGLPVISFANEGAREIIENGVNGYLIEPGDELGALLECCEGLLADRELRVQLGRQARCTVEARYDWRVLAGRYVAIYEGLLG